MKTSKKVFLIIALLFFILMGFVVYDMSRKTTFPGAKKNDAKQLDISDESSDSQSFE